MLEAIQKICEEDPTVRFIEDEDTGQRILRGMGELHLQILFERIKREFKINLRAGKPRVTVRESIQGEGIGNVTVDRVIKAGYYKVSAIKGNSDAETSEEKIKKLMIKTERNLGKEISAIDLHGLSHEMGGKILEDLLRLLK